MLNDKEAARIAGKLENDPRRVLVEQAAGERENALRLGQDDVVERTGRILTGLGYEPEDARAAAAARRKAAAEDQAAKKQDEDDGADGGGKREGEPKGAEGAAARKLPPAGRQSPVAKRQTT